MLVRSCWLMVLINSCMSLLILCLVVLFIVEIICEISSYNFGFVYFSFHICQFDYVLCSSLVWYI